MRTSPVLINNLLAEPYPLDHVLSPFGECRGARLHRGLDIAGVGEKAGLGQPIFAMATGYIIELGRPADDPSRLGRPDRRDGMTKRRGVELPRAEHVPGYGHVRYFTRSRGSSKMGAVVSTLIVGGPLDGYQIRYMHMGEIHPSLRVGDMIERGQELGIMGGTAILSSAPHVHIDVEDPRGRRVDVAPLLGLEPDGRRSARSCRRSARRARKKK